MDAASHVFAVAVLPESLGASTAALALADALPQEIVLRLSIDPQGSFARSQANRCRYAADPEGLRRILTPSSLHTAFVVVDLSGAAGRSIVVQPPLFWRLFSDAGYTPYDITLLFVSGESLGARYTLYRLLEAAPDPLPAAAVLCTRRQAGGTAAAPWPLGPLPPAHGGALADAGFAVRVEDDGFARAIAAEQGLAHFALPRPPAMLDGLPSTPDDRGLTHDDLAATAWRNQWDALAKRICAISN